MLPCSFGALGACAPPGKWDLDEILASALAHSGPSLVEVTTDAELL